MNLYSAPLWLIRPIALFGKHFPKIMLSIRFFKKAKRFINWKHPKSIQEIFLCQLFSPNTNIKEFSNLADKVEVRKYVKEKIGNQYLTTLYGVYNSPEEIDYSILPDKFVIKTNNGCGNNIIIKDRKQINIQNITHQLKYWLKFPYGDLTGQIHYSQIKPQILIEEYLQQPEKDDVLPYDYKFFCHKGEPLYVLFYEYRSVNGHITPNMLFDMNWNPIPDAVLRPATNIIERPKSFDKMKECVAALSKDFEFVRVDFYEINGHPIFGEMTFTPTVIENIHYNFNLFHL